MTQRKDMPSKTVYLYDGEEVIVDTTEDGDVEICVVFNETQGGTDDPGETYLYGDSGDADKLAIALIQATPPDDMDMTRRHALNALMFPDTLSDERAMEIAVSLIRSAVR